MSDRLDLPAVDGILAELAEYVAIPSVSRVSDPATMERAAQWVADQLAWAGGRLEPTAGNPVVRADWLGAQGAPTVLVYGHYDVQPEGSIDEWASPPFELTRDGDTVRGRGVTDDKGPVFIVLTMARAFIEQERRLPLNVKFLIEGEEEIGSPNLGAYVRAHADELACDLVISADGAMWRPTEPSVSTASKGMVSFSVEVTGAGRDLHSGRYGGTVANAAQVLSKVLGSLHADDGGVAVPGFHTGVHELSQERRKEIDAVPFTDAAWLADVEAPELHGEPGFSTLERLWERPTLEVNGLEAGGKYSVIPHVAKAHLSCRLVHDQDPAAVLAAITRHVDAQQWPGVRVRVLPDEGGVPAYRVADDDQSIAAAERALNEVYPGQQVLRTVIAGTLPCATLFEEVLGAKTLFFSFSTSDERLHAPNEFLRLPRISDGMRAWEVLWRNLAEN